MVPQLQFIDKVIDTSVVAQRQTPKVQEIQKTIESPQVIDKVVDVPVEVVQTVKKTVDIPLVQSWTRLSTYPSWFNARCP